MSKIEQHLPDDWHPDAHWSLPDREQEDQYFEPAPLSVAGLAQIASLILFGAMIWVWSAIADVNFPEVPQ